MTTKDERIRFTIRIPKNLYERIKKTAKSRGFSSNALILEIIRLYFEEK